MNKNYSEFSYIELYCRFIEYNLLIMSEAAMDSEPQPTKAKIVEGPKNSSTQEAFGLAKAPFCVVYLVGNSHLTPQRGFCEEFKKLLHPNTLIENFAVGGGCVNDELDEALSKVSDREFDYPSGNDVYVVVMTGDNDLRKGSEPIPLAEALLSKLDAMKKPRNDLVFVVCGVMKTFSLTTQQVNKFNSQLSTLCDEYNNNKKLRAYFLDINEITQSRPFVSGGVPQHALFHNDKIHLAPGGNSVVATILASFLNPLIHKELNCKAPKIRQEVYALLHDHRFVDYVRMKGVFRRSYEDIVNNRQLVNPNRIVGLARELKPNVGLENEINKEFDPTFNYSIVFDRRIKHHPKTEKEDEAN